MNPNQNQSSVAQKLAEVVALNAKTAALNSEIETARTAHLKGIAAELGYANNVEFATAFLAATGTKLPTVKGQKPAKKGAKSGSKARKPRVSIDEVKGKEILAFFQGGGSTVDAVTKFNISLATAQNWKDKAGMVQHRS